MEQTNQNPAWIFSVSEVKPGGSSVLGNNYPLFYALHVIAIFVITCSAVACLLVIISIVRRVLKKNRKRVNGIWTKSVGLGFSDRFPLYIAVTDLLYCFSHLSNYLHLIIRKTFPGNFVSSIHGAVLGAFLGYQQLMYCGLAVYTYLGIVKEKKVSPGRGEWKLHLVCFTMIAGSILVFWPLDAFGSSGYWMLQDVHTSGGTALGLYITTVGTIQGIGAALVYVRIRRVIENKKRINLCETSADNRVRERKITTASECLTRFVLVSIFLYCPLAPAYAIFVLETSVFKIINPVTCVFSTLIGNCIGLANGVSYFKNLKTKQCRNIEVAYSPKKQAQPGDTR